MKRISILSVAACSPNAELRSQLPFPVTDIVRESIPPLLRRRSSQATQLAFSVATSVCSQTGRSPASLPAIFASIAGEIQTTDQLCVELVKPDGVISPSGFHNSVQNTAAGYWSIAQQCRQPASALAAGNETFAMALLEAWCQLACHGGELLLVCYDECWPQQLAPGQGQPAFASALLLAAGEVDNALALIEAPQRTAASFLAEWHSLAQAMPALACLPLLNVLANATDPQHTALAAGEIGWQIKVTPVANTRGAS